MRNVEGLALETRDDGARILTIPAGIEIAEIVQALERFAAQRARAVQRNQASENKIGVVTFKKREDALVAIAAVLSGEKLPAKRGRGKKETQPSA